MVEIPPYGCQYRELFSKKMERKKENYPLYTKATASENHWSAYK